jgi:AraC-like DNA-binding protein/ligand-binding sensor protein
MRSPRPIRTEAESRNDIRDESQLQNDEFMGMPESFDTNGGNAPGHRILDQIHRSELFRNYERAFEDATGLSLKIASSDGHLVFGCSENHRNPFCEMLDLDNPTCEACVQTWRKLAVQGEAKTRTSICFAGLSVSSVPIRIGEKTIGFLFVGEVTTSRLTEAKFAKVVAHLKGCGVDYDETKLREAYFLIPATSKSKYESFLALLDVFAGHLSLIADQLILNESNTQDPGIHRALKFIHENLGELLDLDLVAKSACLSRCYFSRKFKEATHIAFTEYVARSRVEEAKKLLANPQIRVSEIAFQVGFQSLTHFNRVFKGLVGLSPTQFRGNHVDAALYPSGHHGLHDGCSPYLRR